MKTVDEMIEQLSNCIKQKVLQGDYRIVGLNILSVGVAEIIIDEKHNLRLWVRDDKKELTIYESNIFQEQLYLSFGNFNDEIDSSETESKIAYDNFQNLKEDYLIEYNKKKIEANIKSLEFELSLIKHQKI